MHPSTPHPKSDRPVVLGILLIVGIYILITVGGVTRNGSVHHADVSAADGHAPSEAGGHDAEGGAIDAPAARHGDDANGDDANGDDANGDDFIPNELALAAREQYDEDRKAAPHLLAVTPFLALLGAIAIFPLVPKLSRWRESNPHRFHAAVFAAMVTLVYYFVLKGGWAKVLYVLEHAVLGEYIPFIVLLFSLYSISDGIRIEGDLAGSPRTNSIFIIIGGLLASFIGTTGAAMLLIRPLLDTNDERKQVQHTVVFFIFVVCNRGGCLLPIGDPPLFLGYLKGVAFT